jgi:hypothetical protein
MERETTEYVLLHCPRFNSHRLSLLGKFESIHKSHFIHPSHRLFDNRSILNPSHLPKPARSEATIAVASFLGSLPIKI